ncbi:MAG: TAXI family TRAP transporter solute-binding subunit, partial [Oscillospiraceae bacterium]|nr:TAXI family TRAP transporter solute-binding subunit [Oscillospiraceae bacterium]
TCDAAFTWAGIPTASVMELCATHSISMISFSDEELEKLMTVSTYCVPAQITKDTYPKMYEDAQSFSIPAIICANADLDEEFVYRFMTAVFDNVELLAQTHERGADLSLEKALDGLGDATLHPGAERFFREKGILK